MTLSRISQAGLAASDPLLLCLDGAGEVGGDTAQRLRKSGPWANALYDPRNAYRSDTALLLPEKTDMATTTFKIGDITIHRVVEQEGPFFNPLEFFPSLTPEVLEENRGWMTEGGYLDRQSGQLVLCIQSYLVQTPHHNILIDSCVGNHKPRPTRPFWNMLNTDRFEKGLARHWCLRRSDRLCDVHPSSRRPCRVEHQTGERPLGPYVPEGQICLRRPRACLLDRGGKKRSIYRPLDHRTLSSPSSPQSATKW